MDESFEQRWVVGLTGTNAAGKGEIARILTERGYQYYSLSDVLRDELQIRKLEPSRENLIQLGRELRESHGPGVLAAKIVKKLELDRAYVIDSIRHPMEIEILKSTGYFCLIAVDARIELRFERALARGRKENATTLDEFRALEDREKSKSLNAQQIQECMKLADITIFNDGTLDDLEQDTLEALDERNFPL